MDNPVNAPLNDYSAAMCPNHRHLIAAGQRNRSKDDSYLQEEKKESLSPSRDGLYQEISNPKPILSNPAPIRRRQRSVSTGSAMQRRAIFGGFWERTGPQSPSLDPAASKGSLLAEKPLPRRKIRSSSCSVIDEFQKTTPEIQHSIITDLSPPRELVEVKGEHFRHIGEFPSTSGASLPSMPSPLKRFYKTDGTRNCLSGAYPLVAAKPILRQSSYRKLDTDGGKIFSPPRAPSFNLTQTVRGKDDDTPATDDVTKDSESSHSSLRSSFHAGENVQFDPRVTVTEYPDEYERKWYSERELEIFKNQAVLLAQRYLIKNPHLIERYNKPVVDTTTRTLRKRALFSLPVFSSVASQEGALPLTQKTCSNQASPIIEDQVKNILVVDRNAMILDLFRRSLVALFPCADITTVDTAEDAVAAIEALLSSSDGRGYDLIIAEERLHKPLCGFGKPLQKTGRAISFPSGSTGAECVKSQHRRSASGETQQQNRMSGSDLFGFVQKKYEALKNEAPSPSLAFRPLLIGVSTHPKEEEDRFLEYGADFIWGKPPPIMNQSLGYELVETLARKRGSHLH